MNSSKPWCYVVLTCAPAVLPTRRPESTIPIRLLGVPIVFKTTLAYHTSSTSLILRRAVYSKHRHFTVQSNLAGCSYTSQVYSPKQGVNSGSNQNYQNHNLTCQPLTLLTPCADSEVRFKLTNNGFAVRCVKSLRHSEIKTEYSF